MSKEDNKINVSRRDFLKKSGLLLGAAIISGYCKKHDDMKIEFKDSLNNVLGTPRYSLDDTVVTLSDFGGGNLNNNRLALFKKNKDKESFVAYVKSDNSEVPSLVVPFQKGVEYVAYAFPNYSGLDYDALEYCYPYFGKTVEWHHEDRDGFVSDYAVVKSAMNALDNMLHHGTFKEGAGLAVGYGYSSGNAGARTPKYITVNPDKAGEPNIINTFFEEGGESIAGFVDYPNVRWNNMDTKLLELIMNFSYLKTQ